MVKYMLEVTAKGSTEWKDCPHEACSGSEDTMEYFSLFCPINIHIWDLWASKLRILLLHGQTYGQSAFGLFPTQGLSI